jgi:hypothetical protein
LFHLYFLIIFQLKEIIFVNSGNRVHHWTSITCKAFETELGVSGRLGGFLNISCVWFVLVIVLNFRERLVFVWVYFVWLLFLFLFFSVSSMHFFIDK